MVEAVVVDDSQFMRVQIREILEEGGISVVGEAHNGNAAIDAVATHRPDVVTMDVKMPGMDGIEAVEHIMAEHPTPILMLSRYTEEGSDVTFEALEVGAVDFFPKPDDGSTTLVKYADELVEAARVVARADVSTSDTGARSDAGTRSTDPSAARESHAQPTVERDEPTAANATLVIAASTGGPSVVQSIMERLPVGVGLRILVVQHMPEHFTERFAKRLDTFSTYDVSEATDGMTVGTDEAVVARAGYHLVVTDDLGGELHLELSEADAVNNVRPAADVTMESAGTAVDGPLVAVVLTGMGRDGAVGLEHVNAAGGTTLVQSPESADLDSMPRNAIETGAVDETVSEEAMPQRILDAVEQLSRGTSEGPE